MRKLFFTAACLLLISSPAFAAKQTITSADTGAQSRTKLNSNFTELYNGKADASCFATESAFNACFDLTWAAGGSMSWPASDGAYYAAKDGAWASLATVYQPLDSDLTTFSGLACTEGQIPKKNSSSVWVCGSDVEGAGGGISHATSDGNYYASRNGAWASLTGLYQPVDSDLTSIASLTTTAFGIGLLDDANAAAGRTSLGVGTTDSPAFTGLSLGIANSAFGTLGFYGNSKTYPFSLWSDGADTGSLGWKLPSTLPATASLISSSTLGYLSYVDPATFLTPSGVGGALTVTATGFDGNLATTDNTLQEIAQKFDDFTGGGGVSLSTANTWTATQSFAQINAGAAGFAVDADGDVTAKSVTITRTNDPSTIDLYEGLVNGNHKVSIAPSASLSADKSIVAENILQTTDTNVFQAYDADLADLAEGSLTGSKVSGASDTAVGVVELATTAEINTGTSTTLAVTPDGLSGSIYGQKEIGWVIKKTAEDTAVADGVDAIVIPASMNGMNLVDLTCSVASLNSAASGSTTVVLRRVRGATAVNMTSTGVTIAYNEYTASDETVDTSNDDVQTGDKIYADVNAVTTAVQKGLSCTAVLQTP